MANPNETNPIEIETKRDHPELGRAAANFRFEIKTVLIFTCLIAAGLGLKQGHWATFVLSTTTFFTVFIFSEDIWPDQFSDSERNN